MLKTWEASERLHVRELGGGKGRGLWKKLCPELGHWVRKGTERSQQ